MAILEPKTERHLDHMIERYPRLEVCRNSISDAYSLMEQCYERDGKMLIAGNGGSAADSEQMNIIISY